MWRRLFKSYKIKHSFDADFVKLMNRLYRKYGDEIFHIQGIANSHLDIVKYTDDFFQNSASAMADKTVDPNANNSDKSVLQYHHSHGKALLRLNSLHILYTALKKEYSKEIADLCVSNVVNGKIFINDLHNLVSPYCYAFDLHTLVAEGMTFYKGSMNIGSPKRSDSFIDLVLQATAYISNQITGAVAYPNFFLFLDWYYRKEFGSDYAGKMSRSNSPVKIKIRHHFQNLIYSLNWMYRGGESSFTNLSVLDIGFSMRLFSGYVFPNGEEFSETTARSMIKLSQEFFEYFAEINLKEGMFTFPVMTLAISLNEQGNYVDRMFAEWVSRANSKKSLGNVFVSEPNSFSSCCRLQNQLDNNYQNSFGVSGVSVGSHRVAGINFGRVQAFDVSEQLDCLHKILKTHRHILKRQIDGGFLPLYTASWIHLRKQFGTVGFVGISEWAKKQSGNELDNMKTILSNINEQIEEWTERDNATNNFSGLVYSYNLEQIPAESMAVRLAKIDKILGYNKHSLIYSNQYIPLTENVPMGLRIQFQGKLDSETSGGAILHINHKDRNPLSSKQYFTIMEACRLSGTKYFGINYVYDKCYNGHHTRSNGGNCSICGAEIAEQFTRVVGFITSTKNWNKDRREIEYPNRKFYQSKD